MDKIKEIISKEWAEVFKNKIVLFTTAFLPLLFIIIPLVLLGTALKGGDPGDVTNDMPEELAGIAAFCGNISEAECGQLIVISEFSMLFLIIPVMVPVMITAYSIVGEKTTRTLEPLLATPITTIELLVGKALAAAIPALGATWVAYSIFATGAYLMTKSEMILNVLLNPNYLIMLIFLAPLLSIMGISIAVMVSSRSNDPRVAEQLSGFVVLPVLGLFIGQIAGWIQINGQLVFWLIFIMLMIDAVLIYFAAQLFERETILTRWK